MKHILTTTNITKQYKTTTALQKVSIHIPENSIYGLVGNNGAGKTTLMRILLGLQPATSGQVNRHKNIKTGAILELPALYPYWSAKRNLKYQLSFVDNPQYTALELLKMVGLNDSLTPVSQYSLGMRQRLGLALALSNQPDFLFLDEPLNGLDPLGIRQIRDLLRKLNEEQHMTIIISSHILDELQKIATHIGVLKDGKLICECRINEISNQSLENYYFEAFEKQEVTSHE